MKFTIATFALTALIVSGAALATSASADQAGPIVRVLIDNYAYKNPTITIPRGTTVVFKDLDDDPHTVTAVDGSFDSKGLAQGDTFTFRFTKAGTYHYYCKVHPFMKGTVIVKESGS
jgi:plastocyanin